MSPLKDTLRELDLSGNDRLQIDDAAVASILECSLLRTLDLYKSDIGDWKRQMTGATQRWFEERIAREGYTPAAYSTQSLSRLVRLPSAFSKRHGRDLDICLTSDEYARCACSCCTWWPLRDDRVGSA